ALGRNRQTAKTNVPAPTNRKIQTTVILLSYVDVGVVDRRQLTIVCTARITNPREEAAVVGLPTVTTGQYFSGAETADGILDLELPIIERDIQAGKRRRPHEAHVPALGGFRLQKVTATHRRHSHTPAACRR